MWVGGIVAIYALVAGVLIARETGPILVAALGCGAFALGARMRELRLVVTPESISTSTWLRSSEIEASEILDVVAETGWLQTTIPVVYATRHRRMPLRVLQWDRRFPLHREAADYWIGEIRRIIFGEVNNHPVVPPMTRAGVALWIALFVPTIAAVAALQFADLPTAWTIAVAATVTVGIAALEWISRTKRDHPAD